MIFFLIN